MSHSALALLFISTISSENTYAGCRYAESRVFFVDNLRIIMAVAVMLSLIMLNEVVQSYVSRFNVIASFTLLSQQTLTFPKLLYGIKQIKHYF